ncbi:Polyadenylate-binding protein 2 [Mycena venus]|uniref:Polyadenylate-binding protein 2 n=1 Tax=Mycena venus TaxID=2733690 RepID=A0A8H6Y6Y6_9AGAR|nr:Polyadenylate-binding protein 2 [Mycena venus]
MSSATNENPGSEDPIIDDGEEDSKVRLLYDGSTTLQNTQCAFCPQEILLMKQRVAEMEKEAIKLRELQAAAALENNTADGGRHQHGDGRRQIRCGQSKRLRWECQSSCALFRRTRFMFHKLVQVDYGATPEEIQGHFQACGTINRVTILCDKFTGHPKGFAYVEFAEPEHIDAALTMDNSLFRGRLIKDSIVGGDAVATGEVIEVVIAEVMEVSIRIEAGVAGDEAAGSEKYPYVAPPAALKEGKGLMPYLSKTLPTPEKQQMLRHFFSRQSRHQLYPGSIITVTVEHAPMTFTGVLLAIRRRGPDTSFVVRNIIQRTGVEMQFFVNSPHLKEIRLLQKPPKRRMRRAKLYYLRDSPEKMSMLAGSKKYQ